MKNNSSNCCASIIEEDGALITAIRHEWNRLPEDAFETMHGYGIEAMFCGAGGIFQILRDRKPGTYLEGNYKLLKFTPDEETGKCDTYAIDLTEAEAKQLMLIRSALWSK